MEFWREMYEAAAVARREEKRMSDWYKRRAREEARKRKRVQGILTGLVLGIGSAACLASWAMLIGG